ncbi:MAG TPA: 3-hydroxyacyl-CoA dehydrogenase family protein [Thermomicrobiales bacterium]|nr:3-hydroxyacyl-CoA dehydrogenase family protein [Thermomicrobiales bacterium]HRA46543.1 3-hydroxyacyl-CoA dehydrogenase family protein [Thermomicrobiales bacterium]
MIQPQPSSELDSIATVGIIGAGFMGAQLALHLAACGYQVAVVDQAEESLTTMQRGHGEELDRRSSAGQLSPEERTAILARIRATTDLAEAVADADLVIEAVPERLDLKRSVFVELDRVCPPHTILATNSSSIRISQIEDATGRPDRVLNTHFYPPIWQRPMVELMRGTATSDETIDRVWRFVQAAGLTPLLVQKESTGFLFNRVWRAIKRETLHLVDQGVASVDDVDRAWMICMGMPIGPFGLMDMVGLDVVLDIEEVYYAESGELRDAPPRLLTDKVAAGELGAKTGLGFYRYPNPVYKDPLWRQGDISGTFKYSKGGEDADA